MMHELKVSPIDAEIECSLNLGTQIASASEDTTVVQARKRQLIREIVEQTLLSTHSPIVRKDEIDSICSEVSDRIWNLSLGFVGIGNSDANIVSMKVKTDASKIRNYGSKFLPNSLYYTRDTADQLDDISFGNAFLSLSKSNTALFDRILEEEKKLRDTYVQLKLSCDKRILECKRKNQTKLDSWNIYDQKGREIQRLRNDEELGMVEATVSSELEEHKRQSRSVILDLILRVLKKKEDLIQTGVVEIGISPLKITPSIGDSKQSDVVTDSLSVQELLAMGFDKIQAVTALKMSNDNLDQAIVLLLEQPENVLKNARYPPAASNPTISSVNSSFGKIYGPPSGIRKISGWIDKAKQQIEEIMDPNSNRHEVFDFPVPSMSDNFAAIIGNHVKHAQNLRLNVSSLQSILSPSLSESTAFALHTQTLVTLYTKRLKALVLVHKIENWAAFKSQNTYKEFFDACNRYPEFHFASIERQLDVIEQDFTGNEGILLFNRGDVFLTRHSNLPSVHIVFHLFADDMTEMLGSKSPLLEGLRNIFRMCCETGIDQLTIPLPLFFSHDSVNVTVAEKMSFINLLGNSSSKTHGGQKMPADFYDKQIETLLKACKSFLAENTRAYSKQQNIDDTSSASTFIGLLEFLFFPTLNEERFNFYREMIQSIYRIA